MKCLEKDRNRRYGTANALADDLQRHLDHHPVIAAAPSAAYRLGKFVRRHKVAVTAGAAVTAAIMLGFGVSTWLFFKEKAARGRAVRPRRCRPSFAGKLKPKWITAGR